MRGGMPFSPGSVLDLIARAESLRSRSAGCAALSRYPESALPPGRTRENLHKLRQPNSVAVVVNFYPALFGGPAFQIFKCLTAIKLCAELNGHGIHSVPVCWISDAPPGTFSGWSVRILDGESELCLLDLAPQGVHDPLPRAAVSNMLARVEESGNGAYDAETLETLKTSFDAETTLARATARLVSELVKEWGMLVLDARLFDEGETGFLSHHPGAPAGIPAACSALPVVAIVLDPFELDSFALAQPVFAEKGIACPMTWPQASATLIDSRSRRIFQKYGFELSRLYRGAETILREIIGETPTDVSEGLLRLKLEAETGISALARIDPDDEALSRIAASGKERIVYQLDHLRKGLEAARKNKESTIHRQIHRLCNSLAPSGRIQEREVAGIQWPLRYSQTILQSLCDRFDIGNFEHQLIFMD